MKIELKKVYTNARFSEETECFRAEVWIDGVKAGNAGNQGHGGSNEYHPLALHERLAEYAKTLPDVDVSAMYGDGQKHTMPMCADLVISDVLAEHAHTKTLNRLFKKKLVLVRGGKCYTVGSVQQRRPDGVLRRQERQARRCGAEQPADGGSDQAVSRRSGQVEADMTPTQAKKQREALLRESGEWQARVTATKAVCDVTSDPEELTLALRDYLLAKADRHHFDWSNHPVKGVPITAMWRRRANDEGYRMILAAKWLADRAMLRADEITGLDAAEKTASKKFYEAESRAFMLGIRAMIEGGLKRATSR